MEHLPGGDVGVDAELIVEHLRTVLAQSPDAFPRGWMPQATFEELLGRADRDPIHLHLAIHHLHRNWQMEPITRPKQRRGLKGFVWRRFVHMLEATLGDYFRQEREFRAALAQSIDALAYRIDEVSTADLRNVLELIRDDLADLARYVEERIDLPVVER